MSITKPLIPLWMLILLLGVWFYVGYTIGTSKPNINSWLDGFTTCEENYKGN